MTMTSNVRPVIALARRSSVSFLSCSRHCCSASGHALFFNKTSNTSRLPSTSISTSFLINPMASSNTGLVLAQRRLHSTLSVQKNSPTDKLGLPLTHIISRRYSSSNHKEIISDSSQAPKCSGDAGSAEAPCHPDGLPRYPNISSPNGVLRGLDWLGTVSFAASGTLLAGYAGMDSLGCTIVGTITATGGGTVRDILLGSFPVFWMAEVEYLWMILATVGLTFFLFDKEHPKDGVCGENGIILYLTDAVGIGAFAVIGAQNAVRRGLPGVVCVVCGMITATFGGLIRDVLCGRPVRIIHSHAEIYGVTALTGAVSYMALRHLSFSPAVRIFGGVLSAACMRHWAVTHDIRLPLASWFDSENNCSVYHRHKPKQTEAVAVKSPDLVETDSKSE